MVTKDQKTGIFYDYVIVVAGFVLMFLGCGMLGTFGVFFEPMMKDLGWTRAGTAALFSLCMLVAGLVGMVAGRLSDQLGPKVIITACTILLALGYSLMAVVHSAWQFYLFYGVLIGSGMGAFWSPILSTVARWFTYRRGLM